MPQLTNEQLDLVQRYVEFGHRRVARQYKPCLKCRKVQQVAKAADARFALRHIAGAPCCNGRVCLICGWSIELGHKVDPVVRAATLAMDHGECVYCGKADANCIDHVLARNNGGSDEFSNLVTACRSCNTKKGPRDPLPMFYGRFRRYDF